MPSPKMPTTCNVFAKRGDPWICDHDRQELRKIVTLGIEENPHIQEEHPMPEGRWFSRVVRRLDNVKTKQVIYHRPVLHGDPDFDRWTKAHLARNSHRSSIFAHHPSSKKELKNDPEDVKRKRKAEMLHRLKLLTRY